MQLRVLIISLIVALALVGCRAPEPIASEDIQVEVSVEPNPPAVGEAALTVLVSDPDGNPLNVASISVRGDMDHAGMVPVIESLENGEGGIYELPFEWTMGGDWIVEVTVELADGTSTSETFEYTLEGEPMNMNGMDMDDMDMDGTDEAMDMDGMDMDVEMTDEAGDMVMDVTGDDMNAMAGMDMPDMQMGGTSAVYMNITNNGENEVAIISGSADVAGEVELHETTVDDNGVARMVEQGDGIFIPAGETVALEPGGLHVMLLDLQSDLAEGDTTSVSLVFDTGDEITLEPVIQTEAPEDTETIEVGDLVIAGVWARPSAGGGMHMDMGDDSDMDDDSDMGDMDMDGTEEAMDMDMQMGGTSAVYMNITNNGEFDVALFQGESEAAGEIQLHETTVDDNGVARMEEQPEGIIIPAGETVSLEPGGLHVMLLDLQAELVEGDTVNVVLDFDNGEQVVLDAIIQTEAPAESNTIEAGDLVIEGVWARPSAGGMHMDMGDDSDMDMVATEESE